MSHANFDRHSHIVLVLPLPLTLNNKRKMRCLECPETTRKYKCTRCENYCCSFDCFKKHKDADCTPTIAKPEEKKIEVCKPRLLHLTTEDTVDPEKLAELGKSEALKELLRNRHLRDFLRAVDSSDNVRRAMKFAMLEPLFTEFADECLKIIEPEKPNSD